MNSKRTTTVKNCCHLQILISVVLIILSVSSISLSTSYSNTNNNNSIVTRVNALSPSISSTSLNMCKLSSSSTPTTVSPLKERQYDLIIYGATGFTGQIACQYVKDHYPSLKVAYAGRNLAKLRNVRSQVYGSSSSSSDDDDSNLPPLIVADAVQDPDSLDDLAASTRVIANYAGTPFIDKALPVVGACARHGTCYTDITGEVPFQRASYDRYNKLAQQTGSIIVHSCGYDSIPSDLGAFMAATAMKERHGCDCTSIELVARPGKGGVSGGTLHTGIALIFGSKDGKKSSDLPGMREIKARGGNCYGLDPDGGKGGKDVADTVMMPSYDSVAKTAVMPFVMAAANAPVVRKSNAILNYLYGSNCSYREVQAVPNLFVGWLGMAGFGLLGALLAFPPTRWVLLRYVLPKPGEGPSKELQETGFFVSDIYAVGNTKERPVVHAYVKSGNAGDPGYKATARMSIEASLCMALQRDQCHTMGGVLTPATALGTTLVDRLNKTGMEVGVTKE